MPLRALLPILMPLLGGAWAAPVLLAQAPSPCPGPVAGAAAAPRGPDVAILAAVRAEQVRFGEAPRVRVELTGCAVLDTVRVIERRNLPDPVRTGVTYRDVYVAVEILGYLDARCLLRELAGEPREPAAAPAPRRAIPAPPCRPASTGSQPPPPPR